MKTELLGLLCQKFYKVVNVADKSGDPLPGQIVFAHTVYPTDEPWIVKVINYDAGDPTRSRYELKKFEPADRTHFPVAELSLRKDEHLYVYKGKERPLVVVGAMKSRWANPLYDERVFVCAPLFTWKERHSDVFKIECAAFFHPSLFYLPAESDGCSSEGAVRFEYVQPILRKALHNYLAGTPSRPIALSNEAFALLLNHLGRFLFRRDFDPKVCGQMDTYRALVKEELDKMKADTKHDGSSSMSSK
jgi:hypothetical protein